MVLLIQNYIFQDSVALLLTNVIMQFSFDVYEHSVFFWLDFYIFEAIME